MGSTPAGRTTYRSVISNRRRIAVKTGRSKREKPLRLRPRRQAPVVHVEGTNVVIPKQRGRLDDVPSQRMMIGRRRVPQPVLNPLEPKPVTKPTEVAAERRLVAGEDPLRQRTGRQPRHQAVAEGVASVHLDHAPPAPLGDVGPERNHASVEMKVLPPEPPQFGGSDGAEHPEHDVVVQAVVGCQVEYPTALVGGEERHFVLDQPRSFHCRDRILPTLLVEEAPAEELGGLVQVVPSTLLAQLFDFGHFTVPLPNLISRDLIHRAVAKRAAEFSEPGTQVDQGGVGDAACLLLGKVLFDEFLHWRLVVIHGHMFEHPFCRPSQRPAALLQTLVAVRCLVDDPLRNFQQLHATVVEKLFVRADYFRVLTKALPHPVAKTDDAIDALRNEVILCKRVSEHGLEYAVIDHSSVASAYAKAHGPLDVLRTGDNPRQVLRDYLRSERETLELMTNDITANVRLLIAERFPKQDLRRVVNEITRMCKKVARLGFSESLTDAGPQTQKHSGGVRV